MSICAANMKSCDKKAKCLFGPNEGKAYNPKNPCCGLGTFDSSICDCTLNGGIYFVSVELSAGIDQRGPVAYSYFHIDNPYFGEDGNVISQAIGLHVLGSPNSDWDRCRTDTSYCNGSAGSPLIAIYETPCLAENFSENELMLTYNDSVAFWQPWWIPEEYGRGICSWTCNGSGDYQAPSGYPYLQISRYSGLRLLNTQVIRVFEPDADNMKCSGELVVTYRPSEITYIGPGNLEDYFTSTQQRPIRPDTEFVQEMYMFEPDLPGPIQDEP